MPTRDLHLLSEHTHTENKGIIKYIFNANGSQRKHTKNLPTKYEEIENLNGPINTQIKSTIRNFQKKKNPRSEGFPGEFNRILRKN